jgi:hypothetical protein
MGSEGRKSRKDTLRGLDDRQRRLNEMYELGRLSASDYKSKCAEIDEQKANVGAKRPEPVLVRQGTKLATLVDDWDEMTPEERRRVIDLVFAEIHASSEGIHRLLSREDWKPYMAAVLRAPVVLDRWGTERKTGLKPRDVETTRLTWDERGWLRLASKQIVSVADAYCGGRSCARGCGCSGSSAC